MQSKVVAVTTNMFYHGTHIFITITGGGQVFEHKTGRGVVAARSYIEEVLSKHFLGYEVFWDGDVVVYFTYPRGGD